MSSRRLATDPTEFRCRAALGRAVQDTSERGGDLTRPQRLGDQSADAGVLCQDRTAKAAHQHTLAMEAFDLHRIL